MLKILEHLEQWNKTSESLLNRGFQGFYIIGTSINPPGTLEQNQGIYNVC